MFLSKRESQGIKGIAILLMLFHHLFAFPDRIPNNIQYSNLVTIIAEFGKICVPIFLFISGYGLFKTNKRSFSDFVNRIKTFYCHYWLVFILFIPLCALLGKISITPLSLVLNFTGLKTSFNGEWWFITIYILLLLITPVMYKRTSKNILIIFACISFIHFIGYRLFSATKLFYFIPDLTPIIAYAFGFVTAKHEDKLFTIFNNFFKNTKYRYLLPLNLLVATLLVLIGSEFSVLLNIIFPVFIIYFRFIFNFIPFLQKILVELGNRSLYMWLTHTFYCYKLIPNFIYSPKIALLVFLLLLIISYLTSIILDTIFNFLINLRTTG